MSINAKIIDGEGTKKAAGVGESTYGTGLRIYSYEGIVKQNSARYFRSDTYGIDMNIDAAAGGTPDNIHNGTDAIYWTASTLSGNASDFTYDSTDQAQSGTKSVKATNAENNDQAMFTRGSALDLSNYRTLTGGIYIEDWPTTGSDKNFRFYWRDGGTQSGQEVSLAPYINTGLYNQWQNFSIPISAFNLGDTTLDELVMRVVDVGAGGAPETYFDNIALQEDTGGNNELFLLQPQNDEVWEITNLSFVLVNNTAGTVINGTMPGLSYDKLIGINQLSNGINIIRYSNQEPVFTATINDFLGIIELPQETLVNSGSDGANTWVKVTKNFRHPFILDAGLEDRIEVRLSDDLSELLRFRMTASINIYTEVR